MKKGIAVIAALVAVLTVTSGAFAAKQYLITSSSQVESGAIALSDLSSNARKALQGQQGPKGDKGDNGDKGDKGDTGAAGAPGPAGISGYEVNRLRYTDVGKGNLATVACSTNDKVAIGGGYWFNTKGENDFDWSHKALTNGSGVIASFPGRMDWDGLDNVENTPDDNTVKPNDNSGWIVQLNSSVEEPQEMTLYVICVDDAS